MLKLSRLAALLIAGAIVSAPALAAEKGKAFATVKTMQMFAKLLYVLANHLGILLDL